MQLTIKIKLNKPLSLPIAYHHIQQAVIYELMKSDNGSAQLHDDGKSYGKRIYKLFTFGPLEGAFNIRNKIITFFDDVSFEIRVWDETLGETIIKNVNNKGIQLCDEICKNVGITAEQKHISKDDVIISMRSPICAYATDSDSKHTTYFNPKQNKFFCSVCENFERKFIAAYNKYPDGEFSMSPIDVRHSDKYITNYKGFIIEAYNGTYRLKGDAEYLDFLYQTGLGAKNSQGFGMFDVIDC